MRRNLNRGEAAKKTFVVCAEDRKLGGIETSSKIKSQVQSSTFDHGRTQRNNTNTRLELEEWKETPVIHNNNSNNSNSNRNNSNNNNTHLATSSSTSYSTSDTPEDNNINSSHHFNDADNSVTNGNTITLYNTNKTKKMESSTMDVPSSPTTTTTTTTTSATTGDAVPQHRHPHSPHTIHANMNSTSATTSNNNNNNNTTATTTRTTIDASSLGVPVGTPDTTSTAPSTPDVSVDHFTLMDKLSLRPTVDEVQIPTDLTTASPWFVDGCLSQPSGTTTTTTTTPMTLLRWDTKETGSVVPPTTTNTNSGGRGDVWNNTTTEQQQQQQQQQPQSQQPQQDETQRYSLQHSYPSDSSPSGILRPRPSSTTSSSESRGRQQPPAQSSFSSLPLPMSTLKPRPSQNQSSHAPSSSPPPRGLWSPGTPPPPPIHRRGVETGTAASFIPDVGGITEPQHNKQQHRAATNALQQRHHYRPPSAQHNNNHSHNPWNERIPLPQQQNYLNQNHPGSGGPPTSSSSVSQQPHHSHPSSSYDSPTRGGIQRWGDQQPQPQPLHPPHHHHHQPQSQQAQPQQHHQSPVMSGNSPGLPRASGGLSGGKYQRPTGSSPNRSIVSSSASSGNGGRVTSTPQRSSSEVLKTLLRKKACLYEPETSPAVALITWLVGRELALVYGHFSRQQLQSGVHGCVAQKIESGVITRTKVNRCMQIILNSCFHYIIPAPGGGKESSDLFRANFAQGTTDDSHLIRTLQSPWDDIYVGRESILKASAVDAEGSSGGSPPLSSVNNDATAGDSSISSSAASKRAVLLCFNENVRSADDVFFCHNEFIRDTANASKLQLTASEWQAFFGKSTMKDLTGQTRMMSSSSFSAPAESSSTMMGPLDVLGQLSSKDLARFRTTWCAKRYEHDKRLCGFAHVDINGGWLRRDPTVHSYKDKMCPYVTTIQDSRFVGGPRCYVINECSTGIDCDYAHSREEMEYHHLRYKREVCYGVPPPAAAVPPQSSSRGKDGEGPVPSSGSNNTSTTPTQGVCHLGAICPKLHTTESIAYKRNVTSSARDSSHQSSPKLTSNYNVGRSKPSHVSLDDHPQQQQQHHHHPHLNPHPHPQQPQQLKYVAGGNKTPPPGIMPKGAPMLYIKPAPTSEFDKHFGMPGLQSLFRRHCEVVVAHLRAHNGDKFYYSCFEENDEHYDTPPKGTKKGERVKSTTTTNEPNGTIVGSVIPKQQ